MKVEELIKAIDYIEERIAGEIPVSDIAGACYVSVSSLQKTFKYVFHTSINEYILKRRFSCAAKDLLESDESILDISLKYGYSNAESFTRGFRKVWNITPSEFRKSRKFAGHTPKYSVPGHVASQTEESVMEQFKYDLTDMYDVIQERKNNAYVCADICRLMWINDNLGREAGDAAILELMKRIEASINENDLFLRVGGDEFVVITDSDDMEHANKIVSEVTAKNGGMVKCGDTEFALSIHIGAFKGYYPHHVNTAQMFADIARGMDEIHK